MTARFFLVLLVLNLAACGRYEQGQFNLGAFRSFSPVVLQEVDVTGLRSICAALAEKTQTLPQMLNTKLTFNVRSKGCAEDGLGEGEDVRVTIQRSGSTFVFKQMSNGLDFVYPDVETNSAGVMGPICQSLLERSSPIRLPDGSALWFSTLGVESAYCRPNGQERCLKLERGIQDGESFRVTSIEWIKFRLNPNETGFGFFSERRSVSRGICGLDQYLETHVLLR